MIILINNLLMGPTARVSEIKGTKVGWDIIPDNHKKFSEKNP